MKKLINFILSLISVQGNDDYMEMSGIKIDRVIQINRRKALRD